MSILDLQAKNVIRRREERLKLIESALAEGKEPPKLSEALGMHFSIKMPDAALDPREVIDQDVSDKHFALALKLNWYHQGFISLCKKLGVKCYYRSAIDLDTSSSEELSQATQL